MRKKKAFLIFLLFIVLLIVFPGAGCRPGDDEIDTGVREEEEALIMGEGIYVGQIDSRSVEIEEDGQAKAYGLAEEIDVSEIRSGSKVAFTYDDGGERPLLRSIEVIEPAAEEVLRGEGIYTGRIDSRSVEIEVNGEYRAFALSSETVVEGLSDGSKIAFTYRESEQRPMLLAVEVLEEPEDEAGDEILEIEAEGILVGQIDTQSIEVLRTRAFALGEGVDVDHIAAGSRVAFTYTETGERPVLDYIEAVDSHPEGELRSGILVGQIDSHSVEIEYDQAFTLGAAVSVEEIADGSAIVFTYRVGPVRPVITSISGL